MPLSEAEELELLELERNRTTSPQVAEPSSTIGQIEETFQQIPGASVLSELAAGVNRTVGETINFFGVDAINQILEKTGTAFRLPSAPEPRGGFMEPGLAREAVRGAGEIGALAVGAGGLARRAATAIAPAAESTLAQVGRQLGTGTAAQDVAIGALAGAGGEVGEEVGEAVGGETGAQVGRLTGALAAPLPLAAIGARISPSLVSKEIRKAAPTLDQLRAQSDDIYKQIDDLGVTFKPESLTKLADDISQTLTKEGLDVNLTPKTSALLTRIQADTQTPLTATQVDTLRKLANVPASDIDDVGKATLDSRLGNIVIEKLDKFLSNSKNAIGPKEVGPLFKQARGLVSRRKKGEQIEFIFQRAARAQSGFENGLRLEMKSLLNSPSRTRGFTKDELALMESIRTGGKLENAARLLGKFGISLDLNSGGLLAGMTALGGALSGSAPGAIAAGGFIALASGAKQLGIGLANRNADLASAIVRAGSNGRQIVSSYLRSVPKAERNTEELAGLLLSRKIPQQQLEKIKTDKQPLIANAAYIASILSALEDEVPQPTDQETQPQ